MNDEITRTTNEHKRQKWRQFVKTLDHKTDPTKLWRTITAIDGRSTPKAEKIKEKKNEDLTAHQRIF